jgi:hypothetical protein
MSKHFFNRHTQGYKGKKQTISGTCTLPWCCNLKTKFKGIGSNLCEQHQLLMREYGGPARLDRHWTFNKKSICEFCGKDPWQHPKVLQISDELIRDRVAWGMLIVDHIETQRDGGRDGPDNCQTLCLDCNQIKTTLACDSMPRALYNCEKEYQSIKERLAPYLYKLFSNN